MTWLFAVLVVLAMGGVAVVAAGRAGALPEEYDDRPDVRVPAGPLGGDDLRRVRFSLAFRGYRMSEVDTLLARLADQLDDRPVDGPVHSPGVDGDEAAGAAAAAATPDPDSDPSSGPGDDHHDASHGGGRAD